MDEFTETRHIGLGENLGGALKGTLFGFVLLIIAVVIMAWNERSAVVTAGSLKRMAAQTTVLQTPQPGPETEGKAVLLSGSLHPLKQVKDPLFGVAPKEALVLARRVSMYQWHEKESRTTQKELGGGTTETVTYTYYRDWSETPIDSAAFRHPEGHANPPFPYRSQRFESGAVLGGFVMGSQVLARLTPQTPVHPLPAPSGTAEGIKAGEDFYYLGQNPAAPAVGDVKITFAYAPAGLYTVVGAQRGDALVPFADEGERTWLFVRKGAHGKEEIFQDALAQNRLMTWVFRGVGFGVMFLGFMLILGPLTAVADILPPLGSAVGGMTALAAALLTLVLGGTVTLMAWVGARPLLVGGVLMILGGWWLYKRVKKRAAPPSRTAGPPPRRQ
ncbi:MAG: hypothetical protein GXO33_01130 [Epsilonproteobacteria bacterium]|nr:hypothetical protein [Campylobacterota bacterium]